MELNMKVDRSYDDTVISAASQKEIPVFLDKLHGEIMKTRELVSLLEDKLAPVTLGGEPYDTRASEPTMTTVAGRLNDMYEMVDNINVVISELINHRIQL